MSACKDGEHLIVEDESGAWCRVCGRFVDENGCTTMPPNRPNDGLTVTDGSVKFVRAAGIAPEADDPEYQYMGQNAARMCTSCGALVWGMPQHTKFHRELKNTVKYTEDYGIPVVPAAPLARDV